MDENGFDWIDGVLGIGFVAAILISAYFSDKKRKKRVNDLKEWASRQGFSFSEAPQPDFLEASSFDICNRGHSRYAYNVMRGAYQKLPVTAFDYHYAITTHTKKGNRTTHYYFTGILFKLDYSCPKMLIRPEGFFDKVGEMLGMDDIDFESAEFSKKVFVKSEDKKFAYAVIHQGCMEFLLKSPIFNMEFSNDLFFVYMPRILKIEELLDALKLGSSLIGLFPEYLVKQLKEKSWS